MNEGSKQAVGITTTVPVEVIFAAGYMPVDLNNLFVSSGSMSEMVEKAHQAGFPQNTCAWIKGIYGTVVSNGWPNCVVGVVRGDCSGTSVLLEALQMVGVEVIPFSYPYPPSRADLRREIKRFAARLGASLSDCEDWFNRLKGLREKLEVLDRLCWEENKVSSLEAHTWLVSSSDFWGDPDYYERELDSFTREACSRKPLSCRDGIVWKREVRLGFVGVPPIVPNIFEIVEKMGARFVFHEVQRQFSMPYAARDIVSTYTKYTYPYDLSGRAKDIERESERRKIDGVVHYVQSFCHRNLEDVVFSRCIKRPILTIECDCPGELGGSALTRIESFIQVLGENL